MGAVAQLVAHLVRIEGVRGSNPLSSTHLAQHIRAFGDVGWSDRSSLPHRFVTLSQRRFDLDLSHTRFAYTEALVDERAATAIGFLDRAATFFAAHGITRIERVVTDNGSCYRAADYAAAITATGARQQRIRPYTPRHNGKVERYNRILADEFLYARVWTSEQQRAHQLGIWKVDYNYHRRHTAIGDIWPAAACSNRVTNVMASYI